MVVTGNFSAFTASSHFPFVALRSQRTLKKLKLHGRGCNGTH
eukprot:gene10367-8778_t